VRAESVSSETSMVEPLRSVRRASEGVRRGEGAEETRMLAHGGGDSNAFCDDERDWIDRDWNRARAARERETPVGHGGVVV